MRPPSTAGGNSSSCLAKNCQRKWNGGWGAVAMKCVRSGIRPKYGQSTPWFATAAASLASDGGRFAVRVFEPGSEPEIVGGLPVELPPPELPQPATPKAIASASE